MTLSSPLMNPIGSFNDNASDGHSTSGTFVSVGTSGAFISGALGGLTGGTGGS